MVDPELVKLLCCPETHQPVRSADSELLERLNEKVASGQLRNRAGREISEKITAGLLREDGKLFFPIRDDIPVMLVDEAIGLT